MDVWPWEDFESILRIKGVMGETRMRDKIEKASEKLYHAGNWVVRIVGSVIFLVLVWYSLRYTQYVFPGEYETPRVIHDSMLKNALAVVAALCVMAGLMVLEKRIGARFKKAVCLVSLAVVLAWSAAAGWWWIHSSAHIPEGDQAFIYGGASYFIEGLNFQFFGEYGYFGMHPRQMGLLALCELLFRVVGIYNYQVFEMICLAMAVGSIYFGYRILSEMTKSMAVIVGYNLLMLGCLPLWLYTPWVYGDVPSIFFGMLAAWMILLYDRRKKVRYLVALVFSFVLAMLVRQNSMILLVAAILAILLYSLCRREWKLVLSFVLAVALTEGCYATINRVYEVRSGYEHWDGIPLVAWITMGMQENWDGSCGWYNNYPKEVYYASEGNRELTEIKAREDLKARLEVFKNDPSYAKDFFRKKILSQWNAPLYQALYFNAETPEDTGGPEAGTLAAKMGGEFFFEVLEFCDRWQAMIYLGMFLYFLLAVKRDSNILQHVLAITMIGGFFFSIIYEAKARYIMPYYVMMFPFAAYGYWLMLGNVRSFWAAKPWKSRHKI